MSPNTKPLLIAGTRPEVIKLAPVMEALDRLGVDYLFVWSGQHYDYELSGIFFEQLGVRKPDVDLGVGSGTHAQQTASIMLRLEEVVTRRAPSAVVAQGDTNTVLAAALTSAKMRIPFAHVEAGLRSWDMTMPEEVNRKVADAVAVLHFAPTELAAVNLLFEGASRSGIHLTGNTVVDILRRHAHTADKAGETLLSQLGLERSQYVLATIHRAENTDSPKRLAEILAALHDLSREHRVVFSIHPRTRKAIAAYSLQGLLEDITLLPPLGYFEFIGLLMHARVVVTDSGGVQEEAFTLKVPTVTVRYSTERPETTMYGINRLAGPERDRIVRLAKIQAEAYEAVQSLAFQNPLGDGRAGERIAQVLKQRLEEGLEIREPDLREAPVVRYRLAEMGEPNTEIMDTLAEFNENGIPIFNDNIKIKSKIIKIKSRIHL